VSRLPFVATVGLYLFDRHLAAPEIMNKNIRVKLVISSTTGSVVNRSTTHVEVSFAAMTTP